MISQNSSQDTKKSWKNLCLRLLDERLLGSRLNGNGREQSKCDDEERELKEDGQVSFFGGILAKGPEESDEAENEEQPLVTDDPGQKHKRRNTASRNFRERFESMASIELPDRKQVEQVY